MKNLLMILLFVGYSTALFAAEDKAAGTVVEIGPVNADCKASLDAHRGSDTKAKEEKKKKEEPATQVE
jgi:hypothetical protein